MRSGEKNGQNNFNAGALKNPSGSHNIVLFLGYGFDDADKKQRLIAFIEDKYGLVQDGGIFSLLWYPEYRSVSGKVRMSSLTAKLTELHEKHPLSAFITVGSPQGMHTVLASLQDKGMDIPVFSLFPQDEVLGTESGSNLVIDYRPSGAKNATDIENAVAEETDSEYTGDIDAVLSPLIQAALDWNSLKEKSMFIPSLRMEFFKQTGCNLIIYTDSVTGIRSKNHYVLEGSPRERE